ncbi:MAG: hypothetical protein LLF76_04415 [Planctomycetaceae bacterium]|nr:hypothetical protein [Planctomycetaceae bacterium]
MRRFFFGFRRTVKHLRRYRHIMGVLIKYGFEEAAGLFARRFHIGFGGRGLPGLDHQRLLEVSLPQRMRMAAEELGPTFIKLGQLLSTRPDLIPEEYIRELEHLQDNVAPEPYETIRATVKRELGAYPEEVFAEFVPTPIAAASIAQVHRAKTREGQDVVAKIRRPGIIKTLETELEILQDVAALFKSRMKLPETFDPVRMVREFADAVNKEVDFNNERRNQQRFIRNFEGDPTIHVPRVFERYCSGGVLTMEYIDGIKPAMVSRERFAENKRKASVCGALAPGTAPKAAGDESGTDPKVIASRGADFVLQQVFEFGFFHADPHPGNFLILKDNVLAPLDFGQVGRLTKQDRLLLEQMVLAIVDNDAAKMVHGLEQAQVVDEDTDLTELTRDLEDILETYENMPLKDIPLGEAIRRAFDVMRHNKIEPPRDFTLMLKSLMTIEAFATEMDPEFQIIEHLKPYARRFTFEQIRPKAVLRQFRTAARSTQELAARLPDDVLSILGKFRRGRFKLHIHHEHLEELEETLDVSSNRVSFSVIIAALLMASSFLVPQEGTVLGLVSFQTLGIIGYLAAAFMGIWLLISIIRYRKY